MTWKEYKESLARNSEMLVVFGVYLIIFVYLIVFMKWE